jgi:hypothetical protein
LIFVTAKKKVRAKMGADLYIEKLPDETRRGGFEVSEEAVQSGYFRDCYNPYGLFWVMRATLGDKDVSWGLSWWVLVGDDDNGGYARPDLFERNEEGCTAMKVEGVKIWHAELKPLIEKFCKRKVLYTEDNHKLDEKTKKYVGVKKKIDPKEIAEYRRWAKSLLTFMEIAIQNNSRITFSV